MCVMIPTIAFLVVFLFPGYGSGGPTSPIPQRNTSPSPQSTQFQQCIDEGKAKGISVEAALCANLDALQRELDKIDISRCSEKLKSFTSTLEAYVSESGFDYKNFGLNQDSLQSLFSEITDTMRKFQKENQMVISLQYAKKLLSAMSDSAQIMGKGFSLSDGRNIVFKFIELNIGLVILEKSLDTLVKRPSETNRLLFGHLQNLVLWKAEFDSLPNPSLFMTMAFHTQKVKTRYSLEQLRNKFEGKLLSGLEPNRFIRPVANI